MQLQRKIYWDQLKMCYFCECVKPQKKKKAAERYYSRRPCSEQWLLSYSFSAGPNKAGISLGEEEEERKAEQGKKGPGMNIYMLLLFCS